jgi:polyketide cyclase/dehydrase/lipid transport protein
MHTNRSETRQISIPAPPGKVLDVVGDAQALPRWAPNFATTVRAEDGHWVVNDELHVDLRVDRELGTVDILRPKLPPTGAYSRVVPNGEGSEYLFTLFFPDGAEEAAITKQMATVEEELRAVRELCSRP